MSSGAPDVPHAVIEEKPPVGSEGNSVGSSKAPPVRLLSLPISARSGSHLTFEIVLPDKVEVTWDCAFRNNNLYVEVPHHLSIYGSRDSFVSLIEYAESEMLVDHVVVCLAKNRPDRADIIRLFMFMGFTPVAPGVATPLLVPDHLTGDYIFLAYEAN